MPRWNMLVRLTGCGVFIAVGLGADTSAWADTVVLEPSKDNTLIEDVKGSRSNGLGDGVYSGRTGTTGGSPRKLRALLAFDVASVVPAGSTIISVSLQLTTLNSVSGAQVHTLHRVLGDWGEGASNGGGGSGNLAEPGDATWLHRFYADTFWNSPGGDFLAQPSGAAEVGTFGEIITWTNPNMAVDAQHWLDDPGHNFGWVLIGNEGVNNTAKKFASGEWDNADDRPKLTIDFTPAVPCPADVTGNQVIDIDDLLAVINSWGSGAGPADVTGNGVVDIDDLLTVINSWGPC